MYPLPGLRGRRDELGLQLGVGVVAYLLLEALKAALRLAGGAVQACRPRRRSEQPPGSPPWLEGPGALDFAKLAAEQARASRERSKCQAVANLADY